MFFWILMRKGVFIDTNGNRTLLRRSLQEIAYSISNSAVLMYVYLSIIRVDYMIQLALKVGSGVIDTMHTRLFLKSTLL